MLSQDITVKGATPLGAAALQPGQDQAETVFGASGLARVGDDVGMGRIEHAGGRRSM